MAQVSYAATCGKKGTESQGSSDQQTHSGSSEQDPYSKCLDFSVDENSPAMQELQESLNEPQASQEQKEQEKFKEKLDQLERDMSELDSNSDDYAENITAIQQRFSEMAEKLRNNARELEENGIDDAEPWEKLNEVYERIRNLQGHLDRVRMAFARQQSPDAVLPNSATRPEKPGRGMSYSDNIPSSSSGPPTQSPSKPPQEKPNPASPTREESVGDLINRLMGIPEQIGQAARELGEALRPEGTIEAEVVRDQQPLHVWVNNTQTGEPDLHRVDNARGVPVNIDSTPDRVANTLAVIGNSGPEWQNESRVNLAANFATGTARFSQMSDILPAVEQFTQDNDGQAPHLAISTHGGSWGIAMKNRDFSTDNFHLSDDPDYNAFRQLRGNIQSLSLRNCRSGADAMCSDGSVNPTSFPYMASAALGGAPVTAYDQRTAGGMIPNGTVRYTISAEPYNPWPRLQEWSDRWLSPFLTE